MCSYITNLIIPQETQITDYVIGVAWSSHAEKMLLTKPVKKGGTGRLILETI
jgi:hypothetical protein